MPEELYLLQCFNVRPSNHALNWESPFPLPSSSLAARLNNINSTILHATSRCNIMASSQAPSSTTTVPIPNGAPLLRSNTTPTDYAPRPFTSDRSLLTPEDAIYHGSPPRKQSAAVNRLQELRLSSATVEVVPQMARRHKDGTNRNGSRRRKTSRTWKKLLWVKQSCRF